MTLTKQLQSLNACGDAIAWVGRRRSGRRAWLACERGDWLLWLAARVGVGVDRRLIVLAACDCAEHALVHVPPGEDRPARAIATARAWAAGDATLADVQRAGDAAYAAYYAASAAYAANATASAAARAASAAARAALAAANAAYAAYYAANSAYYAANAAAIAAVDAAANAAYAAAAAAWAQHDTLKRCADLVRARITWDEIECLLT